MLDIKQEGQVLIGAALKNHDMKRTREWRYLSTLVLTSVLDGDASYGVIG